MHCPNCTEHQAGGRKFCPDCGTPLAVACGNCGSPLDAGAHFCGECGTPVATQAAPTPPTFATPAAQPTLAAVADRGERREIRDEHDLRVVTRLGPDGLVASPSDDATAATGA